MIIMSNFSEYFVYMCPWLTDRYVFPRYICHDLFFFLRLLSRQHTHAAFMYFSDYVSMHICMLDELTYFIEDILIILREHIQEALFLCLYYYYSSVCACGRVILTSVHVCINKFDMRICTCVPYTHIDMHMLSHGACVGRMHPHPRSFLRTKLSKIF